MLGMTAKVVDETHRVKEAVERTAYRNLGHAAASIRKTAIQSITKGKKPSEPGEPPHTRGRRKGFKRAILYAMEGKEAAVVGTARSRVGEAGQPHEHGGRRGKQIYPPRPFMAPALGANLDRMAKDWEGSLGQ